MSDEKKEPKSLNFLLKQHNEIEKDLKKTKNTLEELSHRINVWKKYLENREKEEDKLRKILYEEHGFLV